MHDGEQYLCLKHYVGRFVNSNTPLAGNVQPPSATSSSLVDKLSILLISVPKPDDRINPAETFSYLPGAEEETTKILEALKGVDGVEVSLLAKKDATYANVFKALKTGRYHIVHYAGHAIFNTARPNLSALVLNDRNMATGSVCTYFGANPPLLCFMNACDSGKSDQWTQNYNIFGLAQALLATGSYLIGSRWNLEDEPAVGFAVEFYTQLVKNGMPIGEALMQARTKTKSDWKDSFTWASYVFYGDPRVYFRRATP
jgi:CHAT domain-containing protein